MRIQKRIVTQTQIDFIHLYVYLTLDNLDVENIDFIKTTRIKVYCFTSFSVVNISVDYLSLSDNTKDV